MPKFERDPLVALIIGILVILSGFGTLFADIVTAIGSIICGAGIIVFAFYWQKKRTAKAAAKAEEEAKLEALKAEEAARIKEEEERRKVNYTHRQVWIVDSFGKNEDGSDRQNILRKIKREIEPFEYGWGDVHLEDFYEADGSHGLAVVVDGFCIGNFPASEVRYMEEHADMIAGAKAFEVVGGGVIDGEKIDYEATITIKYYASEEDKAKAEAQALEK